MGGNPGKIDLYVGKEVVKKNIPMDDAPDALIQLIKVRFGYMQGMTLLLSAALCIRCTEPDQPWPQPGERGG